MKAKKYRDAFMVSDTANSIAAQIATLRAGRKWTQKELAEKVGMKQSRISYLEDPNFRNVEVATLQRLASAFDVALLVRMVPFSELVERVCESASGDLSVRPYEKDNLTAHLRPIPTSSYIDYGIGQQANQTQLCSPDTAPISAVMTKQLGNPFLTGAAIPLHACIARLPAGHTASARSIDSALVGGFQQAAFFVPETSMMRTPAFLQRTLKVCP